MADARSSEPPKGQPPPAPAAPLDILLFEAVMSAYFQRLIAERRPLAEYFKRLYELSWKHPLLRGLDVQHATGIAKLRTGTRREAMAEALADALEGMTDITLIETGRPIVLREAGDTVEQALQALGESESVAYFRSKLVIAGILRREEVEVSEEAGSEAPAAAEPGRQILLIDSDAAERDTYIRKLVAAALRRNDSVLVMLVKQSRRAFLASLGMKEAEVEGAVRAGHVLLVQCRTLPELVEEAADEVSWVITVPPDASGLARAVKVWLEKRGSGRMLAVLDVGAMVVWEGGERALKAAAAVRSRLRRDGVNALYLVERLDVDPKLGVGFAAGFDEVIERRGAPAVR